MNLPPIFFFRAALLLLCFALPTGQSNAATTWATRQGNAAHNGYVPRSYTAADFEFRWSADHPWYTDTDTLHPVAAGDGKVFTVKRTYVYTGSEVTARDARTGSILWSQTLPIEKRGESPPAYYGGKVLVDAFDSGGFEFPTLYAFDGDTGSLKWTAAHSAAGDAPAPTSVDGLVYTPSGLFGGLAAFDLETGVRKWSLERDGLYSAVAALDGQTIYVPEGPYFERGSLTALDGKTGATEYQILNDDYRTAIGAPILGFHNNVFALRQDQNGSNRLTAYDLASRSVAWETPELSFTEFAIAPGEVFLSQGGRLSVRAELTGDELWSWMPPKPVDYLSNIVVTDSHVFLSTYDFIYAIDRISHLPVWEFAGKARSLAIADDMLYVAQIWENRNPQLFAFQLAVPEPSTLMILIAAVVVVGPGVVLNWGNVSNRRALVAPSQCSREK